jgi:putative nucleotidyltransferase with HDIG domain/PAS domain S-box-containing protein
MVRTGNPGGGASVATIEESRPSGLMDEVAEYEGPGQAPNAFMVVVDDEGLLIYASLVALAAFGLSQGDAIGTSLFRYVEAGDLERVLVHHSMVLQSPETVVADSVHIVSSTHEAKTFEIETSNRLQHAHVTGIVMRGREVTERDRFRSNLRTSLDQGSDAVAKVIHSYDPLTAGHQRQVTDIAAAVALELQLGSDAVRGIEVAAALHDIGEIADTSGALTRPGALTGPEFALVKIHAEAGAQIVSGISFPWPVADMIRQHHERLDGSGYPSGLSGDEILLGSQVIAVADVVSAMSSHRLYRPAVGVDAALAAVEIGRGRQFRTDVVDACLRLFREKDFHVRPVGFE